MKYILLFTAFFTFAENAHAQGFYDLSLSRHQNRKIEILKVFPNPGLNQTNITLGYAPSQKVSVDILDFNAQVRRTYHFPPGSRLLSMDISFLEKGYYVFRVREESALIDIAKFVKS